MKKIKNVNWILCIPCKILVVMPIKFIQAMKKIKYAIINILILFWCQFDMEGYIYNENITSMYKCITWLHSRKWFNNCPFPEHHKHTYRRGRTFCPCTKSKKFCQMFFYQIIWDYLTCFLWGVESIPKYIFICICACKWAFWVAHVTHLKSSCSTASHSSNFKTCWFKNVWKLKLKAWK